MSAMPQIAKLPISTTMTTVMTVLPSQFFEALRIPRSMGSIYLSGGAPARAGHEARKRASPDVEAHHKVAQAASQPAATGRIEAAGADRQHSPVPMELCGGMPLC